MCALPNFDTVTKNYSTALSRERSTWAVPETSRQDQRRQSLTDVMAVPTKAEYHDRLKLPEIVSYEGHMAFLYYQEPPEARPGAG